MELILFQCVDDRNTLVVGTQLLCVPKYKQTNCKDSNVYLLRHKQTDCYGSTNNGV